MTRTILIGTVLLAIAAPVAADPQARVTVLNFNAANVGLNDPTPVAPVGGNPGTTLGAQRRYALQYAANIWSRSLRSHVEIFIAAQFGPRTCTATSAVLASTGVGTIDLNFKRAPQTDTWYHGALADALAKTDLDPGFVDIVSIFNIDLGSPLCFAGSPFYLGVDGNQGPGVDLVTTALHEFAHGLGFSQFANVSTGALLTLAPLPPLPDVYNSHILDTTTGRTCDVMTNTERRTSAINSRRVAWIGPNVTAAVPSTFAPGVPLLRVSSPASVAGAYAVGTATFGPLFDSGGVGGQLVAAIDAANAAGPTTTDGCSAITNNVVGTLVLIDRGTCAFTIKVKNAQNAGAVGVVIADNAPGSPPAGMSGVDPTIVIPSVRVTQADGVLLRAHLAESVLASMLLDLTALAGATPDGFALLYTPNPVAPGSTISHWDTIATPNQLMEPAINPDLTHDVGITLDLLRDEGWQIEKSRGHRVRTSAVAIRE